ncbi:MULTISPECIES: hypothetical protein [Raoultella]|uniref:hypothetical protein n=1 Tax=Raoultella TaxID=160674 RepID=UPI0013DB8356|nr:MULTISPECIES: hypothetical protein [Raoultella]EKR9382938.1 hypothetical protein [Raoultella ornithinolytica]
MAYAVAVNEKICFNRVNPVYFILSELKQRPSGSQFIDLRNGYLPRLPTRCESLLLESNSFLCISIVNAPDSLNALSLTQRPASYAGLLAKFSRQDNRPPPGPPPASLPGILFGPGDSRDGRSKPIAALTDDCIHWIFSMLLKS